MSAVPMKRRALRWRTRMRQRGVTVERWPLPDSLDANLNRVLRAQGINVALDVGANRGQYYRLLRGLGYDGLIVCFEPASLAHEWLLRATADDPNAEVRRLALGAEPGVASLRLFEGTSLNSLRDANARGQAEFPEMHLVGHEEVEVRPLDSVIAPILERVADPRLLLKCDTQGFDLEVLRGAERALEHVRAVQVELAAQPLYEGMELMHEVVAWLWERDFGLVGMSTIHRDADDLKALELDAVFAR